MTLIPRALVLFTLLVGAAGCASMSANECEFSDWYVIGVEDGTRGRGSDAIEGRRKACARHGFGLDFDEYQRGRRAGLQEFCQPQRGFDVGSAGRRYRGVCPAELEPAFLDAYQEGAQLHTLRSALASVDSAIEGREHELAELHDAIADYEQRLIAPDTATDERVRLLAELKQSTERVGGLEAEIDELIHARAVHERELVDYEQWLASRSWR